MSFLIALGVLAYLALLGLMVLGAILHDIAFTEWLDAALRRAYLPGMMNELDRPSPLMEFLRKESTHARSRKKEV